MARTGPVRRSDTVLRIRAGPAAGLVGVTPRRSGCIPQNEQTSKKAASNPRASTLTLGFGMDCRHAPIGPRRRPRRSSRVNPAKPPSSGKCMGQTGGSCAIAETRRQLSYTTIRAARPFKYTSFHPTLHLPRPPPAARRSGVRSRRSSFNPRGRPPRPPRQRSCIPSPGLPG